MRAREILNLINESNVYDLVVGSKVILTSDVTSVDGEVVPEGTLTKVSKIDTKGSLISITVISIDGKTIIFSIKDKDSSSFTHKIKK